MTVYCNNGRCKNRLVSGVCKLADISITNYGDCGSFINNITKRISGDVIHLLKDAVELGRREKPISGGKVQNE